MMDDPAAALCTLNRLRATGVRISIDDFGTGYSSLAYLQNLPVDELKIDKSFVMNMTENSDDKKIVKSVIDLAHNFDLTVVAEGIEDAASFDLLNAMGCDLAQGFFLGKPMPFDELLAWNAVSPWGTPGTDR
jgi:diguanylate cyclase